MTDFERMRVGQLLGVIDKCCLSVEELRELRQEINTRVVQIVSKEERELIYGKPKDGRSHGGSKRKNTISKSETKRRLCLAGKLYRVSGRSSKRLAASKEN